MRPDEGTSVAEDLALLTYAWVFMHHEAYRGLANLSIDNTYEVYTEMQFYL
jgi:hypothetical protein